MTLNIERQLPMSLVAERAVLGALIVNPPCLVNVMQHVSRNDFFLESHRQIYHAIEVMYAEGTAIDILTLGDKLASSGELESSGRHAYLAQLIDGFPKISNVTQYAKTVRDRARRRELIHTAHRIIEDSFEATDSAQVVIEKANKSVIALNGQGEAGMPFTWSASTMSAMDEILQSINNPGSVMRLNSGMSSLDELTSGLRREDLVLIVGQTSHGKSLLASMIATKSDDQNLKGIIFSAEMSKEALAKRELAHTADVPLYLLRRPELIRNKEAILARLTHAAGIESRRKLLVVDADVRPERIWSLCELTHRTQGLDFVIVDYDQLVVRAGMGRRDDEFADQAKFVADALALSKRLKLCFILLCQPRKVDDDLAKGRRIPRVEDIFGSSAVANTAHHILWVVRTFFQKNMDPEFERVAVIYVLKARNDKAGSVKVEFDPDRVIFTDAPKVEEKSLYE